MASVVTYNDFRYGMVSEYMRRRADLATYQRSASLIENLVPMRTGGVRLRPGAVKAIELPDDAIRIIPFVISVREHYLIILSPNRLFLYQKGLSGVYENVSGEGFTTGYTESEIREVQTAHSYDRVVLVQRNHPPFVVQKGSTGGFSAGTLTLDTSTDAYVYTYDDDGNESKSALQYDYQGLFTENNFPSVAAFCANRLWLGAPTEHPYRMWASKPFEYNNFQTEDYYNALDESVSVEQYMDALRGSGQTQELMDDETRVWEVTRTVDQNNGIVVVTSAVYEWNVAPDTHVGSKGELIGHREYNTETDSWGPVIADGQTWTYSYSYTKPVYTLESTIREDSAMMLDMASDRDETISWIAYSGDFLFVGTASSEWVMSSAINALNPTISKVASYGSAPFIPACYGVNSIFYVQSGKKQLRAISANGDSIGYSEITYQCSTILSAGVVEMAWQRVPEPRLYCILGDGTVAVLCYDRDYDINAWCLWKFADKAISTAVIDTEDGQEVFIILEDAEGNKTAAILTDGVYSDNGKAFTGHLITNNLDSVSAISRTKKTYNVGVDAMRTRFLAGTEGTELSASFDYDHELVKMQPWTKPTYEGLRYEFRGYEGEDMILLALMIETEAA